MAVVLVTGAAGFIGFHLCKRLAAEHRVIALDSFDDYYDVALKRERAQRLAEDHGISVTELDITHGEALGALFERHEPTHVVHLAARPGVRSTVLEPYLNSNLIGFARILDAARTAEVEHFVFASSSSVYGGGATLPFRVDAPTDNPLSIYAATKKANEVLAQSYSNLFGFPTTALRLFTVYGPWGRPDMAVFKFAKAIVAGHTLKLHGNGELQRDFTYIDDVVESIARVLAKPPPTSQMRILNMGTGSPVTVLELVKALEDSLGMKANVVHTEAQPGEAKATQSDTQQLADLIGQVPQTVVVDGIARFVEWFQLWRDD